MKALTIMQDDGYVTLTHQQSEVMCYDTSLIGPVEPSVLGTSPTWNVFEWRWTS